MHPCIFPHTVIVFDQNDSLSFFCSRRRWRFERSRGGSGSSLVRLNESRKVDFDRGAMPSFAVNKNMTAGLLYEAMHHSKAETGAFANSFSRIKRLENVVQEVGRNPYSGVGHTE